MKTVKKILKKTGWVSILESIIFAILGIILVCKPEGSVKLITYILGTVFILVGIYKIITYLTSKTKNNFFNYDLIYGLMAIIIGIIAMAYMNVIGSIFRIVIGVWIVYTALVRMNSALQIKKLGSKMWKGGLVLSVIIFICGLYTIINSGAVIVTIGIIMIIYSIIDMIENIIFMKDLNKLLN